MLSHLSLTTLGSDSLLLLVRGVELTLLPQLVGPALEVEREVGVVLSRVGAGDDPGCVGEEEVHLLERLLLCLWEEKIEEEAVTQVSKVNKEGTKIREGRKRKRRKGEEKRDRERESGKTHALVKLHTTNTT